MPKPFNRHISFRLTDKDVLAKIERLDEPISEFMRRLLVGYLRGDIVDRTVELKPLDAAKLRGVELDNQLKQKRLDDYSEIADLKKRKLVSDIELNAAKRQMSKAILAKLTAPLGDDGYRYMLAYPNGEITFVCPRCSKTIATGTSYNAREYIPNKIALANHMATAHYIDGADFDKATAHYFDRFERTFYGQVYPVVRPITEVYPDELKVKELPAAEASP